LPACSCNYWPSEFDLLSVMRCTQYNFNLRGVDKTLYLQIAPTIPFINEIFLGNNWSEFFYLRRYTEINIHFRTSYFISNYFLKISKEILMWKC